MAARYLARKFNTKLHITKYMGPNFVLLSSIYSDICLIIDIQDGHFKVQDGGQVPCQYQFHIDPFIVKCMCANLGFTCCKYVLKYASFVLTATIFKFKMSVRYHVGSDW